LFVWSERPVITHCPVVDKSGTRTERHIGGNREQERIERKDLLLKAFQSFID
jgi:hypothetical protein